LGQGRRLAQHRRHDRGGDVGGLGGKAATSLNTATLELVAVLSFPGGATPRNALGAILPVTSLEL
jgi:hypothetical protein